MTLPVEWKVLNPTAEYEKTNHAAAAGLPSLAGKKIGLFSNGKNGSEALLNALGDLLQQQFKDIQLLKFNLWVSIGPNNIKQIAQKCDAVVSAVGD